MRISPTAKLSILIVISSIHLSPIVKKTAWTAEQLSKANTGVGIPYLQKEEKEIIKYLNLCRLYPMEFAALEVKDYPGLPEKNYDLTRSTYKKSLLVALDKLKPMNALQVDSLLTADAQCFSRELGESGRTGHQRTGCTKYPTAECISYSMEKGKDVVLQLLIDHDVPSLGHRKICLDPGYKTAGCAQWKHIKYTTCAVLELKR